MVRTPTVHRAVRLRKRTALRASPCLEPIACLWQHLAPVKGLSPLPRTTSIPLIILLRFDAPLHGIRECLRAFRVRNAPRLILHRGLDQPGDGIDDGGCAHGVGFDDIQPPPLAQGGVQEQMSLSQRSILRRFRERPRKTHHPAHSQIRGQSPQRRFHVARAHDIQRRSDAPVGQASQSPNAVVDSFVRREP